MRRMMLSIVFISIAAMHAQDGAAQERTVVLHVSAMTCGTCPISVRHRALQLKGVHATAVDLDTATATVTYEDSEITPQAIAAAITTLGYPATVRKVGR